MDKSEDALDQFSKLQVEFILLFQRIFEAEDTEFKIAAVTHKKSGEVYPCLLMENEDSLIPIGILSVPGDGILDEYDFDNGSQGKNSVGGVDFVYSSEYNENVVENIGWNVDKDGNPVGRPGFLKRIFQRLLNR